MILGLDYGQARVGVAVYDPAVPAVAPRPHKTLTRRARARDLEALAALVRELRASLVVVGAPLAPDGGMGVRARQAAAFARDLAEVARVEIVLQDERDSSIEAMERLIEAGVGPRRRAEMVDQVAAALILERYLRERSRREALPAEPASAAAEGAP